MALRGLNVNIYCYIWTGFHPFLKTYFLAKFGHIYRMGTFTFFSTSAYFGNGEVMSDLKDNWFAPPLDEYGWLYAWTTPGYITALLWKSEHVRILEEDKHCLKQGKFQNFGAQKTRKYTLFGAEALLHFQKKDKLNWQIYFDLCYCYHSKCWTFMLWVGPFRIWLSRFGLYRSYTLHFIREKR